MSEEEINYWLEEFEDNRRAYMSGDGKVLSFYKTFENMKELQQENTQLKKSLENAQEIYKNSHKYTSECEDKVIELKRVLKEIRELLGHFECGQVCECTQELAIHVLEKINKVIGENK